MDIKNEYGLIELERGYFKPTRNGFEVLCPHIMPKPVYVDKTDEKGNKLEVRWPQEATEFRQTSCSSICAKFHISKKGDKQLIHCQHEGDVSHELTPSAIKLIPTAPKAPEKESQQ